MSTASKPAEVAIPTDPEHLCKLLNKAQEGDASTLPVLREFLEAPANVDKFGGDLARHAQLTLIDKCSGKNLLRKEALRRKLDLLREELAGPNPTPLERLLVDRVVTCWLHLHHLEAIYAGKESMSLPMAAYYERSRSSAQKRYLGAIKTLALVRKLAVPVLQVNIAKRQVNVAGVCAVAEGKGESPERGLCNAFGKTRSNALRAT